MRKDEALKLNEALSKVGTFVKILLFVNSCLLIGTWFSPRNRVPIETSMDVLKATGLTLILIMPMIAVFTFLELHPEKINWASKTEEEKVLYTKMLVRGGLILLAVVLILPWFRSA